MTADAIPVALQARSRQTQERILEAALALVADAGVEALTVSAIAERAAVAVGSVYRRFGDKDRLLLAVQQAFADRVRDEVTERLGTLDRTVEHTSEEVIAHVVRALTATFQAHANVLKVFLVLGLQNSAVFQAGSRASIDSKRVVEDFLQDIDVHREDRAAAIDFAFRLLYAALAHRVTQGENLESDRPLPWSDLERQLTAAVCSYLLRAN
jgi:AcrR family transcriptional regulator